MRMLGKIVEGLDRPETVLPEMRALAVKHVEYGVEAHHYATVGTALLRTLRHEIGADFTPEMRAAWAGAYQFLSDTMREAAHGPSRQL
jgi:nitric oxide dioxygenase